MAKAICYIFVTTDKNETYEDNVAKWATEATDAWIHERMTGSVFANDAKKKLDLKSLPIGKASNNQNMYDFWEDSEEGILSICGNMVSTKLLKKKTICFSS